VEIVVPGHPAPQGSKHGRPIYKGRGAAKQFTGKVAMVESSEAVEPWRTDVRKAFEQQWTRERIEGPVVVYAVFAFYRPQNHFLPANRSRPEPVLRADAPGFPITKRKNDVDKLLRSTLDAITSAGKVWEDDSSVVGGQQLKVYVDHKLAARLDGRSGAIIRVYPVLDELALPADVDLLSQLGF
jgi:Holliday junction resolvase RusA-like endonuclease